MSERWPDGGEEPDLTTVAHDDLLLDVLGEGGGWAADVDGLTAMLAAWRADLTVDEENADVTLWVGARSKSRRRGGYRASTSTASSRTTDSSTSTPRPGPVGTRATPSFTSTVAPVA